MDSGCNLAFHSDLLVFVLQTTIQSRNETVPLLGRNGLLGEEKTSTFVDVACGKGALSDSVYVISQNGILCQLIDRQIAKTVELKVSVTAVY